MEYDTKMCSSTIACKIAPFKHYLAWKTASVRASVMKAKEKVIWNENINIHSKSFENV